MKLPLTSGFIEYRVVHPCTTPPSGHPCLEKVLHLGKPQDRTFRSPGGEFFEIGRFFRGNRLTNCGQLCIVSAAVYFLSTK
jgi:hypothetical protein